MTEKLRERLIELAADAPDTLSASNGQLWRAGERRRHRGQVASGLVLVLVLTCLVGVVGLGVTNRSAPAPTSGSGTADLPAQFFAPSPWLGSTADHPIGPLVAIFGAERRFWRGFSAEQTNGIIAVSATTGTYRFLDLPDSAGFGTGGQALGRPFDSNDAPISLSPDGEYVAYWLSGSVGRSDGPVIVGSVGYAVYDTVSGSVVLEQRTPNPHGLVPVGFAWTPGALWAQYRDAEELTETSMGGPSVTDTVALPGMRVTTTTFAFDLDPAFVSQGPDGFALLTDGRYVAGPGRTTRVAAAARSRGAFVGQGGQALAVLVPTASDDDHLELSITYPEALGPADRVLPGESPRGLFGWRDDGHVVVLDREGRLSSVDVLDGRAEVLSDAQNAWTWSPGITLAAGLLDAEVVPGRRPARAVDPRLLIGLAAAGLAGSMVLVLRRRRALA